MRLRWIALALLVVGTAARVAPLLDPEGRALRQYPSEDGYLMLTIARNLALGNGMSVEAGSAATNGTQPLMTAAYAGLFWIVGGDKVWGVVLAQLLGIAIALAAAALLYRLARALLGARDRAGEVAAFTAALWYAAPLSVRFTQNGLETGAAALVALGVALYAVRGLPGPTEPWPAARCAALGLLLGLAFWIRNDGALLAAAVCGVRAWPGRGWGGVPWPRRVGESVLIGGSALAVAVPWLAHNLLRFGHVVPVSGLSEGLEAGFGENLALVPPAVFEYLAVVVLVPLSLESRALAIAGASLATAVWIAVAYRFAREAGPVRAQLGAVLGVWALLLTAFYGLHFGAGYFMSRYLFPLGPFAALVSVAAGVRAWRSWCEGRPILAPLLPAAALALALGLNARDFARGTNNGHFQVVDWVERNVADDVWVAAIQTGTLGYFHDRTYNLDGKVSPAALEARRRGRIFEYVLERPVAYIVDWAGGVDRWVEGTELSPHFEVLELDREANLAVLRRVTPVPAAGRDRT